MQFGVWAPFLVGGGARIPGSDGHPRKGGIRWDPTLFLAGRGGRPYFWGRPGGVSLVKMSLFLAMNSF